MKILVFSEREVPHYKPVEPYIHISISSPNSALLYVPANKYRKMTLYCQFHDLDHNPNPTGKGIILGAGKPYRLFNEKDAQSIWYWVKRYIKDINVIIVNCEAGISRSAGVAAALSKVLNDVDDYYFKKYLPNMLVYRKLLEEYYTNESMYKM